MGDLLAPVLSGHIFCLSSLFHLLKKWSLRQTRGHSPPVVLDIDMKNTIAEVAGLYRFGADNPWQLLAGYRSYILGVTISGLPGPMPQLTIDETINDFLLVVTTCRTSVTSGHSLDAQMLVLEILTWCGMFLRHLIIAFPSCFRVWLPGKYWITMLTGVAVPKGSNTT